MKLTALTKESHFNKIQILSFQVQVVTMPCWERTTPTCACALIFQAGRDIYLIDRCKGARFSGFLLADDGVLDVYEKIDNRYQVSIIG